MQERKPKENELISPRNIPQSSNLNLTSSITAKESPTPSVQTDDSFLDINNNAIPSGLLDSEDDSDNESEGEVEENFPEKRYNSLAWLVQGDGRCGAAYFDGTTLFLATNELEASKIFNWLKAYLHQTALYAHGAQKHSSPNDMNHSYVVFSCLVATIKELLMTLYFENAHFKNDKDYRINVVRSLFKVCFSIACYSLKDHFSQLLLSAEAIQKCNKDMHTLFTSIKNNGKFPKAEKENIEEEKEDEYWKDLFSDTKKWLIPYVTNPEERVFDKGLITALLDNRIQFIPGKTVSSLTSSKRQLHAEMRILQKVYDFYQNDIDQNNRQNLKNISYYIGISKLCCLNCECAMKAFHQFFYDKGAEQFIRLREDDGSKAKFPALSPEFLKNPTLAKNFLWFRYPDTRFTNLTEPELLKKIEEAFSEGEIGRKIPAERMNQKKSNKKSRSGKHKTHPHRSKNTHRMEVNASSAIQSTAQKLGDSMSKITNQNRPTSSKPNNPSSQTSMWRRKENQDKQIQSTTNTQLK